MRSEPPLTEGIKITIIIIMSQNSYLLFVMARSQSSTDLKNCFNYTHSLSAHLYIYTHIYFIKETLRNTQRKKQKSETPTKLQQ